MFYRAGGKILDLALKHKDVESLPFKAELKAWKDKSLGGK